MSEKIMVFVPAYNCEKQIPLVLEQFTPEIKRHLNEILVVENRSPDVTLAAAEAGLRKIDGIKVTLMQNVENWNLGGSNKVAFDYALEHGYDYMIVLHGDDQGGISDLIPHLEAGTHRQYDALLGARFAPGSKLVGYSKFRTYGNIVFNAMISMVTFRRIYDMGAGLNMYDMDILKSRYYLYFPNDLTFNVYMLFYSIYKKQNFKFFSLVWREDDQVSNAKIYKQAWHIVKMTGRYLVNANGLLSPGENEFSQLSYDSKVVYTNKQQV